MAVYGIETPAFNGWIAGAANASKFMLTGGDFGDGFVWLSNDGHTWYQGPEIGYPGTNDACATPGGFVIVGQGGFSWAAATYSTDNGASWASGDLDINPFWEGVVANDDGSIIVAVGSSLGEGVVSRSLDGGATWSSPVAITPSGSFPAKVAWNGSRFIMVTYDGFAYSSPGGAIWGSAVATGAGELWDVIGRSSDEAIVAVGSNASFTTGIFVSMDGGSTWTEATPPAGFTDTIVRVTGMDTLFLVIEDGGSDYSTSADGLTWSAPVTVPDAGGIPSFFDDAEFHRADACGRGAKFDMYLLLVTGDAAAVTPSAFFHFTFGM